MSRWPQQRPLPRWRCSAILLALALALALAPPTRLWAARRRPVSALERAARRLIAQMHAQGQPSGEQHLSLAALYARAGDELNTYAQLRAAGREGIEPTRVRLVLALLHRRVGDYDAAIATLTKVLVKHPEHPYALLQLWKTAYEAQLRAAALKTDLKPVLERLDLAGMHLPPRIVSTPQSSRESAKLTAAGYRELLAGRTDQAIQLFAGAIEVWPSNPRAHRGLGIARAREQDLPRAAGAYQLYLELAPDAADAHRVDGVLMQYWRDRSVER